VERILAQAALPGARQAERDQLSGFSRVRDAFGQLLTGGTTMSQPQNGNARRRNTFIGIGLAALGAVLFGHYVLDIPTGGQNLSGTVAPAQRYRSEQQIKQSDVKLGDQEVAQLLQNDAVDKLLKDPGFQKLAANQEAMAAFAANAATFAALASQPGAFQAISSYPAGSPRFLGSRRIPGGRLQPVGLRGLREQRRRVPGRFAEPEIRRFGASVRGCGDVVAFRGLRRARREFGRDVRDRRE
jgi:hypothetical protein